MAYFLLFIDFHSLILRRVFPYFLFLFLFLFLFVDKLVVLVNKLIVFGNKLVVLVNKLIVFGNKLVVLVNKLVVFVNKLVVFVNKLVVFGFLASLSSWEWYSATKVEMIGLLLYPIVMMLWQWCVL